MQIKYFAAVPYPEITTSLEKIAAAGLGLEIEVVDPHWILKVCELPMVGKLGSTLRERGMEVNVQGPFLDLSPGSLDPYIREHTRKLFLRSVEIAGNLKAKYLTLYTGYNPLLHSRVIDQWFEICLPLWQETIEAAERYDMKILIANMFEESPDILLRVIQKCPEGSVGICFDVAHAFSNSRKKIQAWLNELASGGIDLVHLSDAREKEERRLSLGEGKVPFKEFYQSLMKRNLAPGIVFKMTVDDALQSLATVRKLGLGQYQIELL